MRLRLLALVAESGQTHGHFHRSGRDRTTEKILSSKERPGNPAAFRQPLHLQRTNLPAGLNRLTGEDQFPALRGGRSYERLERGSQIALRSATVIARVCEVTPADQREHCAGFRLRRHGRKLHILGLIARFVRTDLRMLPAFFSLKVRHRAGELRLQPCLPTDIECGVNMNSTECEVLPLHDLLKLPPHLPQRVGGLAAGLSLLHKPYFHTLHIIRTFFCDETGGHHPREGLVALLHRPIEIPAGRKKVRATDNPHDHGALAGMKLRSRLAKIRPSRLLHPISTGTIVDSIQVIREDFILRVVGLDPQR